MCCLYVSYQSTRNEQPPAQQLMLPLEVLRSTSYASKAPTLYAAVWLWRDCGTSSCVCCVGEIYHWVKMYTTATAVGFCDGLMSSPLP